MTITAGTKLGRYEIRSKLGAGGMGEVYLAEDAQLGRRVAIKLLPPETISDEHARKRLVREARAAATLDHPNICSVYEVGEAEGRSFIAMQYVEGETLDLKLKQKPLELKESLTIASQIADALTEAHTHGIIHRDIKPSNIIITARGQAKVMDFGLAKVIQQAQVIESEADTEALLSTPGAILGTIPYMSPEQVRGEALDARSDIFSFGVVLYEMLSGRQPFASESAAATISAILTHEPPPLARYASEAPDELQRMVRKCLEKDREQRYQSARELSIDFKNLQRDSDVRAFTAATTTSPRPEVSRRFTFVALALLSLAVICVGVYWLRGRSMAVDSIAILPFVNVNANSDTEYLSDGITDSLINSLSQLPKLKVIARSSVFNYKGKEIDPQTVGRELNVQALVTGWITQRGDSLSISVELMDTRDKSHIWGEQYNRKISDLLAVQEEISREISGKLRLRLTGEEQERVTKRYTENTEAYQLYLKGRYFWNKRTEEGLKKGIEYFQQAIEKDPNYAPAYAGLADCDSLLPFYTDMPPREAFPRAKTEAIKALEIDQTLAEAHSSLAYVKAYYDWDWSEAEREFKRSLELNPNYATAHHAYSRLLASLGRLDEARAEIKRAHELDPLSLGIQANLGMISYFGQQYDQAIKQLQETLELDQKFFVPHWGLGLAYEQKGMYEEAIAHFQQAVSLSGASTNVIASLGHAYAVGGREREAQKIIEELKDRAKRGYVSSYQIALVYIGLGHKDQAIEWLENAYQERSTLLGYLKMDPRFDSLRSDPRFADLLRRIGFAP